MKKLSLLAATVITVLCVNANASIVLIFPEVNGPNVSSGFPLPEVNVSTLAALIPAGETIVGASLSGIWGRTSQYSGSTAHAELFVNGLLVSDTQTLTPSPYFNVVPFTYNYTLADLASLTGGSATLSYIQTSQYVVRLSNTTLTIDTAAVPEPSTYLAGALMLLPFGFRGIAILRRRNKQTA